jgi:hypothetical protein
MQREVDMVPARVRAEQHVIDSALAAGASYVVNEGNDGRRVHRLECWAARDKLDRHLVWHRDTMVDDRGTLMSFPRMPRLVTRAELEQLTTYVCCRICAPEADHSRKRRGDRAAPWPVRRRDRKHRKGDRPGWVAGGVWRP